MPSVKLAAITSRDRLLDPIALLVSGASRLVPVGRRKQMDVAAGNHCSVLAVGAYLFVEAVKSPAAGSAPL